MLSKIDLPIAHNSSILKEDVFILAVLKIKLKYKTLAEHSLDS